MNTNRITEYARLHRMHAGLLSLTLVTLIGSTGSFSTPVSASLRSANLNRTHQAAPFQTDDAEATQRVSEERVSLLARTVTLRFFSGTGTTVTSKTIALADHPEWIAVRRDLANRSHAILDRETIRHFFAEATIDRLQHDASCDILREKTDGQGVIRIETSCIAEPGYGYEPAEVGEILKTAFETNASGAEIALRTVTPTIVSDAGSGMTVRGTVTLLASGHSDFKGSGEGRKANVRKALNEHVNNIVIPEGATFSFNSVLGEKVTLSTGWKMALAIMNGKDLVPSPGGGICQASSTMYRAVLRAGLPIVDHKSHSLFVHYYEAFGVGLDATIFPGHQDMTFINDTPGPLVIQSYNRGDEAFVNIFGIDDHRSVRMDGPYFGSTAPKTLLLSGHNVRNNEIAWKRSVILSSGERKDEVFGARYLAIPKSLAKRSPFSSEMTRGTDNTVAMHTVVAEKN